MEKPLRKEIRLQWVHCNFPHYYTIFDLQSVRSFVHCSNSFCCWTAPPHPLSVQHAAVHLPRVQCISHYYFVLFLIHLARRYTTNWEIDLLHFWWNFLQSPLRSNFLALLTLHLPLFAHCFFIVKNAASQKLIDFANQVALQLGAGWSVESHYLVLTLTFSAPQQPPTDMQPDQRMPRTWGVRHKLGRTFRDNLSYQSVQYTIYAWWSIIKPPKWC